MCYEDLLAPRARELATAGADFLVNLTNDDWFGDALAIPQHQQLARLRTVETRRYLVRATTTGSTAVISPIGTVVAQAPLYEPAVLLVDLRTVDLQAFYARHGDLFGWGCVLFVLARLLHALGGGLLRGRRE
jgi:apolipoprotein N-acyltransferase